MPAPNVEQFRAGTSCETRSRSRFGLIDHRRHGPTRFACRSSANQTSRGMCRSDFGIIRGFAPTKKPSPPEREVTAAYVCRLLRRCARARANFRSPRPARSRPFQSVTLISGDFPYLSLSRLKLRSPPCDGSIVDVWLRATALTLCLRALSLSLSLSSHLFLPLSERVSSTTPLIRATVLQMRRRT